VRYNKSSIHWPTRINELAAFGGILGSPLMPAGRGGQIGAGTIIREVLEAMPHIVELATGSEGFAAAYETAEYAVGLVAQAYIKQEMKDCYVPAGTVLRRWSIFDGGGTQRSIESLDADFQNSGLKNALLTNGFADGYASAFNIIEKQYRESLATYGRNP
jgi:hypothetical protein